MNSKALFMFHANANTKWLVTSKTEFRTNDLHTFREAFATHLMMSRFALCSQ